MSTRHLVFFLCKKCGTLCISSIKSAKTYRNRAKNSKITRRSTIFKVFRRYFYAFTLRCAGLSCLWGCANRIVNGRAACDSHHVNEDTLQNTYTAAIRDMIEDAEEIMTAVKESAGLVMEPENRAALDRIEQEIIDLQNAVLELHKAKQQRSVTAADYAAQIKEYSQRMQELEAQQAELQTTENRYAEVKLWLDSFAEHIQSGAIMDAGDSMIMKQLVEQIIVGDDGIEVHFKCGIVASHEYM